MTILTWFCTPVPATRLSAPSDRRRFVELLNCPFVCGASIDVAANDKLPTLEVPVALGRGARRRPAQTAQPHDTATSATPANTPATEPASGKSTPKRPAPSAARAARPRVDATPVPTVEVERAPPAIKRRMTLIPHEPPLDLAAQLQLVFNVTFIDIYFYRVFSKGDIPCSRHLMPPCDSRSHSVGPHLGHGPNHKPDSAGAIFVFAAMCLACACMYVAVTC